MQQKFIVSIMLIMLSALSISCSKYKEHLGGNSADYSHAAAAKSLVYPKGVEALSTSDRYAIPETAVNEQPVDLSPPDYQALNTPAS